jgi:molybdate/tungstate transport system substrate-binding protein
MVIAYNPNGRYAARLKQGLWWQVLEEPGFRFGRTDPVTDPQGRNILFVMQLAAEFYQQPDLARRILGEDINPRQIFTEPSVQARLQSGELDAASAYKVQPAAFHLPSIALPDEINLGNSRFAEQYRRVSITLNGKTWRPEPLVYYAAALKGANHPREAARFVEWLQAKPGQEIFTQLSYDPPGAANELT